MNFFFTLGSFPSVALIMEEIPQRTLSDYVEEYLITSPLSHRVCARASETLTHMMRTQLDAMQCHGDTVTITVYQRHHASYVVGIECSSKNLLLRSRKRGMKMLNVLILSLKQKLLPEDVTEEQ